MLATLRNAGIWLGLARGAVDAVARNRCLAAALRVRAGILEPIFRGCDFYADQPPEPVAEDPPAELIDVSVATERLLAVAAVSKPGANGSDLAARLCAYLRSADAATYGATGPDDPQLADVLRRWAASAAGRAALGAQV